MCKAINIFSINKTQMQRSLIHTNRKKAPQNGNLHTVHTIESLSNKTTCLSVFLKLLFGYFY
jgi:hypothetical protein